MQAVPGQNCPEPKELLATEANPIDAPDSVVRPPKEAVLTPQQQQEQASALQSHQAAKGAFSGGGMQAAEFKEDGFVDVERFLSQQVSNCTLVHRRPLFIRQNPALTLRRTLRQLR